MRYINIVRFRNLHSTQLKSALLNIQVQSGNCDFIIMSKSTILNAGRMCIFPCWPHIWYLLMYVVVTNVRWTRQDTAQSDAFGMSTISWELAESGKLNERWMRYASNLHIPSFYWKVHQNWHVICSVNQASLYLNIKVTTVVVGWVLNKYSA